MLVVFHEGPMDGVVSTVRDEVREIDALGTTKGDVDTYRYTGERVPVGTGVWAMEFKPEDAP